MRSNALLLIRTLPRLGARSLLLAGVHRAQIRAGGYRRMTPPGTWGRDDDGLTDGAQTPFVPPDLAALRGHGAETGAGRHAVECGDRIMAGEMLYFSHQWRERPADWRTNPDTGCSSPLVHWSQIPDFDEQQGDIKLIWEPSRFDWVYKLGRAWAHSGDAAYVDGFWRLLEDWRSHNPPNLGPNWMCGQECSLRLMSLVWAAGVFKECAACTPERLALLWETVARLAERIVPSVGYSLAQNNNHALSEGAALYAAGVCLPGHSRAASWRRNGFGLICRLIHAQFGRDGSYAQHSHNYTRLALRDAFYALRVARAVGDRFPDHVRDRLSAAALLLYQMQDSSSGQLPNYGHNDGANILDLSGCDYLDYRPVLQSMAFLLDGVRWYEAGPWDEELLWHFGPEALISPLRPPRRRGFAAEEGGYYVLRDDPTDSLAAIRCHTYRTRPAHADALHLDYWFRGVNVLLDAGSYSYSPSPGWHEYFAGTESHNTVTVDGRDQMKLASRFLWLDWTRARKLRFEASRDEGVFEGEHESYTPVIHRRRVTLRGGLCVIVDDLQGDHSEHRLRLHWAVADLGLEPLADGGRVVLPGPGGTLRVAVAASGALSCDWVRAQELPRPRGWYARHYGSREPAWSLVCETSGSQVRFVTIVGPDETVTPMLPLHLEDPGRLFEQLDQAQN